MDYNKYCDMIGGKVPKNGITGHFMGVEAKIPHIGNLVFSDSSDIESCDSTGGGKR